MEISKPDQGSEAAIAETDPGPVPHAWARHTYAEDQPEYNPLPALVSIDGRVVSRWTPTPEERMRIMGGADLYLTVHTFGQALQPLLLTVGQAPA